MRGVTSATDQPLLPDNLTPWSLGTQEVVGSIPTLTFGNLEFACLFSRGRMDRPICPLHISKHAFKAVVLNLCCRFSEKRHLAPQVKNHWLRVFICYKFPQDDKPHC